MVCQHEEDEMESGMKILRDLYARMVEDRRTEVPMRKLRVGLKCGGSDGFSGITANPLLGCFSDYLVAQGGTTVLTEVPEMFGAETLLMARCKDETVFERPFRSSMISKTISSATGNRSSRTPRRETRPEGFPPWKKSHWDVHRNPERLPCAMCWNMERPCLLRD